LVAGHSLARIPYTPDTSDYKYIAQSILHRGTCGFADDWKKDEILSRSEWRFLYDEAGTVRAPGYSVVLAGAELLAGPGGRDIVVDLLRAVMCGISALLVYRLAMSMYGLRVGILAGLLCACSPADIWGFLGEGREPFLPFFVLLPMLLTLKGVREGKWTPFLVAGICLGVGSYFKETTITVGVVAAFWAILFACVRPRATRLGALLMLVCAALLTAPWMIRNSLYYHRPAGMSTLSGLAMWKGLVKTDWMEDKGLKDMQWAASVAPEKRERLNPYTAENGYDADRRIREIVSDYVKQHPLDTVVTAMRNMALFWSPVPRSAISRGTLRLVEIPSCAFSMVVDVLALVAVWIFRRRADTWLIVLMLMMATVSQAPFCGSARYRIPFDAIVIVLAAAELDRCICWGKRWGRQGGATQENAVGPPAT
jgi:hypothetical protein